MNKKNLFKTILEEIKVKRGGEVINCPFDYPEYKFQHSDVDITVTRAPLGRSPEFIQEYHTYVIISLKKKSLVYLSLIGKVSPFVEKLSKFIIKIMPFLKKRKTEIPEFTAERIRVYSNDNHILNSLFTKDIINKIISVNRKFSFFRVYIERYKIFCSIEGMPSTALELEELIDITLFVYDRFKTIT